MKVAKVIGNIWATRKEEKLAGLKFALLVQPLDVLTGKAERPPSWPPISSAPAWGRPCYMVGQLGPRRRRRYEHPVDATVVGIVDDQDRSAACSPDREAPRHPARSFRERNGHTS